VQPYVCSGPGNPLRYELDAELHGLLVVLGPDSGWIRISAGGHSQEHLLWDRDCYYDRLGVFLLEPPLDAGAALQSAGDLAEPAEEEEDVGVARIRSGDTGELRSANTSRFESGLSLSPPASSLNAAARSRTRSASAKNDIAGRTSRALTSATSLGKASRHASAGAARSEELARGGSLRLRASRSKVKGGGGVEESWRKEK
jgi:hypothetical protein